MARRIVPDDLVQLELQPYRQVVRDDPVRQRADIDLTMAGENRTSPARRASPNSINLDTAQS